MNEELYKEEGVVMEKVRQSIIITVGDQNAEQYEKWCEWRKKWTFVIRDYAEDQGITWQSEALYHKVKDKFGKFTSASIKGEYDPLILKDEHGNELHLSGCSSGYTGTGPHGTLEVLNDAGFKIDRRFVFSAKTFDELLHPDIIDYNDDDPYRGY
jgi:hypothetical protein